MEVKTMEVKKIQKIEGRIDRVTGARITERLRVAPYCRVSTDSEEQKNSYNSQLKYYQELITRRPEWVFVDIYADEAISGTLDYKRTDFMRMINDALNGKIDLIITKSISRFARNTLDTLKYVRMLKEKNIAVLFEEENINTLEMSGELLLTILSSVAQQESENISEHVKLGIKMKRERGELVGFNRCLGYKANYETNTLEIIEEEAEIVRYIFDRYIQGAGSTVIARELNELGKKPIKGNKFQESSIRGIIRNEKYKGDVLMGKTFTVDAISHKRVKNYGEEDMYYIENHHEPIVSVETYNKAHEILEKRAENRRLGRGKGFERYSRKYAFSSMIYCGCCGKYYTRRNWNSGTHNAKRVWQCTNLVKKGKDLCPKSKGIPEEILEECFLEAYKLLVNNNSEIIESFISNMEITLNEIGKDGILEKIDKEIEKLNLKMNNLVDMKLEETITNDQFETKRIKIAKSIEKKQKQRAEIEEEIHNEEAINLRLEKFKEIFANRTILEKFDREVFECLIEKIIIGEEKEDGTYDPYIIKFICRGDSNSQSMFLSSNQDNSSMSLSDQPAMWSVLQCLTLNSFEIISTVRIEWLNVRKFIFHI